MKENKQLSSVHKAAVVSINIFIYLEKHTPYPIDDILDFMKLTGIKANDVKPLLIVFNECGITNLKDVNRLVMLGYFHYQK